MMRMNITPYVGVGNFNFTDDYNKVVSKIGSNFKSEAACLINKTYRIYSIDLDLIFNFSENKKSILFFEFFNSNVVDLIFNNISLFKSEYSVLEKKIKVFDAELTIHESGFCSKVLGIEVRKKLINQKYSNQIDNIIVFSKEYSSEKEIDLNALYKAIMGSDAELYK